MATLLLPQIRPLNRKQRLLEYLNIQESETLKTKSNEQQIEEDIEAVFEELVADSDDAIYITDLITENVVDNPHPQLQIKSKSEDLESPFQKERRLSEEAVPDLEKYKEKFESVVETANYLHQQLQDVAKEGIILCEDKDVSFDEVKSVVEREHSPIPEHNKKKRRVTSKPVKKILHVTGDSTLEYFEDCQTVDDIEALEQQESPPVQQKKKKRRVSKKSPKDFVHVTGDSPQDEFKSKPKCSPNSWDTDEEAEFPPATSALFPFVCISNPQNMVIGPNKTSVNIQDYENIDWTLSAPIVTRKLLLYIFGRDILSTHSLTGKPSPAFLDQNKPLKKPLDAKKVADIVYIVTQKKDVKAKEVRLTITSKCADEQKMRRARMSK